MAMRVEPGAGGYLRLRVRVVALAGCIASRALLPGDRVCPGVVPCWVAGPLCGSPRVRGSRVRRLSSLADYKSITTPGRVAVHAGGGCPPRVLLRRAWVGVAVAPVSGRCAVKGRMADWRLSACAGPLCVARLDRRRFHYAPVGVVA